MWQNQWLVVELPLLESEWALEDTELRDVQASGLSGEGVRVCMVDTGMEVTTMRSRVLTLSSRISLGFP